MVVYELDKKNGKRLELVEDFALLKDGEGKYTIIYDPLYKINERGVKIFVGLYEVIGINGKEERIGFVSADYNPISIVEESLLTKEQLEKDGEEFEISINPSFYQPKVEFIFEQSKFELDITPYEYITKRSFLHPTYDLQPYEVIYKGLTVLNSYTGTIANTLAGLFQRLICRNGLTLKGLALKFRHRFLEIEEKIKEKVRKATELVKTQNIKDTQTLMKPIKRELVENLLDDLKRYRATEKIIDDTRRELILIQQTRNGEIPIWDYIQVLTALTTYKLNQKRFISLKNKLNKQAFKLLENPLKFASKN
jgi:hypothetical protein